MPSLRGEGGEFCSFKTSDYFSTREKINFFQSYYNEELVYKIMT